MKRNICSVYVLMLAAMFFGCEENEIMPDFTRKGSATATVATIAASKSAPKPSESITITVKYVNPSSDPLTDVVLKAQVGTGAYAELQSFNVQGAGQDQEITQTVNYTVPATVGTKVTFDLVLSSQKEYPQIKRSSVTVR